MIAFTASNGIEIKPEVDWLSVRSSLASGDMLDLLFPAKDVDALREYFQHERDQELGRWRDPENPDVVVYPNENWVWVLHESTGAHAGCYRTDTGYLASNYDLFQSARRYFDAHPAPEPRPWEEAKPGEVWVISFEDEEYLGKDTPACVRKGPNKEAMFDVGATYIESVDPGITAGRRIWPEPTDMNGDNNDNT